jgi:two-component system nitrogen regulation response regulator NtrX
MKKTRILIVDDDTRILTTLGSYLRESGFEITTAATLADARKLIGANHDLILLDLALPDGSGIDFLRDVRTERPDQSVVMISGQATLQEAVTAIKLGAADFLEKPTSPEKVEVTIRNALRLSELERRQEREYGKSLERHTLVGSSPQIKNVRSQIDDVCGTDAALLILGESGTGKEIVANLVHLKSPRGNHPFVEVNAAAIPAELIESELFGHEKGAFTGALRQHRGRFEQADSGTLFLDEIAEMPARLQAKLLRVLEDHKIRRLGGDFEIEVDIRLICATNRDLQEEIRRSNFRQDLYFRINVFAINLPPLRQIRSDIPEIARHHLTLLSLRMGRPAPRLSDGALTALNAYDFPGNVRELRNLLEHLLIVTRGDSIDEESVRALLSSQRSSGINAGLSLKDAVQRFERDYIKSTIADCNGNISKAAENLGLDRSYLYRKLKSLGLEESGQ